MWPRAQLIKSQTAMGRKGGDLWLIYRLFEQGMVNCQDCRHVIWHNWWHVARNRESACIHLLCKSIHISKSGRFMCIYTTSPPNFTTYTHVTAYIKREFMVQYMPHYGGTTRKHFPSYWPLVKGSHQSPVHFPDQWPGFHGFFVVVFLCQPKQTTEKSDELPVIWDTMTIMWCHSKADFVLTKASHCKPLSWLYHGSSLWIDKKTENNIILDIYKYDIWQLVRSRNISYTVDGRYHDTHFFTILHTALRWQRQNVDQTLNSQLTRHTSPSRASYGVSVARILEKIDRVITAPHCIWL